MKSEQLYRRSKIKESNASQNGDVWSVAELCVYTPITIENNRDLLAYILAELSQSDAASLMIREAAQEGWRLGLSSLGKHDFHLDVPSRHIVLDNNSMEPAAILRTPHSYNSLLVSMIRALRDVWQEKRHGGFDEHYTAESVLLLERIRAADCDVVTVLTSWQLRNEGQLDLWRYILGSEEGDMGIVYSNMLEAGQSTHAALTATFRQWFNNVQRINNCDHETLEYMDDVLIANIDGSAFGKKRAHKACVEILSCLPDKTPYLRGQGDDILSDPLFAGLCDPINQSHFLQVVRDSQLVIVQNVPFRDAGLAAKIFPGGDMTPERQTDAAQKQ